MSDNIQIQVQDDTGNWRTYQITINNSQMIRSAMRQLKEQFPENRVRAVDMDGRFVDMLP
jgi:hypothetical protein